MNEDNSPPEKVDQIEYYDKIALDDVEEQSISLKDPIGASLSAGDLNTTASDGSIGNTEVKKRTLSDVCQPDSTNSQPEISAFADPVSQLAPEHDNKPIQIFQTEEENTQALIQHMLAQDQIETWAKDSQQAIDQLERKQMAESPSAPLTQMSESKKNLYDEMIQAQLLEEISKEREFDIQNGIPPVSQRQETQEVWETLPQDYEKSIMPTLPNLDNFPPPLQTHSKEQASGVKKTLQGFTGWLDKTKKSINTIVAPIQQSGKAMIDRIDGAEHHQQLRLQRKLALQSKENKANAEASAVFDRFNPEGLDEQQQLAQIMILSQSESSLITESNQKKENDEAMVIFRQQTQAPINCIQIEFDTTSAAVMHPNLFNKVHVHRLIEKKRNDNQIEYAHMIQHQPEQKSNQQELFPIDHSDFAEEFKDEEDSSLIEQSTEVESQRSTNRNQMESLNPFERSDAIHERAQALELQKKKEKEEKSVQGKMKGFFKKTNNFFGGLGL